MTKEQLLRFAQENYVKGELQSLKWISTAAGLPLQVKLMIAARTGQLEQFLASPKSKPDFSGEQWRPIPKFGEGE